MCYILYRLWSDKFNRCNKKQSFSSFSENFKHLSMLIIEWNHQTIVSNCRLQITTPFEHYIFLFKYLKHYVRSTVPGTIVLRVRFCQENAETCSSVLHLDKARVPLY